MPWVKLDDGFFRHPKVLAAGRDARDLHLAAMCYAAANLTGGVIPAGALRSLAAEAQVSRPDRLAAKLVDVGLWEASEDGGVDYRVHDWHAYNPTREHVLRQREDNARRLAEWRLKRAENGAGNSVTGGVRNAPSNVDETLSPSYSRPIETSSPTEHHPLETDTEVRQAVATAAPPRPPVRPVPKPSESPEARSEHRLTVEALVAEFHPSEPPNAAEIGRIVKASKLLRQSHVQPPEVHVLAERARERWGDEAEVTPLGIANNVTTLRTDRPAAKQHQNGRRVIEDPMEQSRRVAMSLQARSDAEQVQRRALA